MLKVYINDWTEKILNRTNNKYNKYNISNSPIAENIRLVSSGGNNLSVKFLSEMFEFYILSENSVIAALRTGEIALAGEC